MGNSIREALEEAVEKSGPVIQEDEAPAAPAAPVEEAPQEPSASPVKENVDEPAQAEKQEAVQPDAAPSASETAAPKREEVTTKAPASWKAGVRERWGSLPPEVRDEVVRREKEIALGLQQAAEGRKFAEGFQRFIDPYRAVMAAEGVADPMQAIQGLLTTASGLRMGHPQQKAQIVADIIASYGVDVQLLDSVLTAQLDPSKTPDPYTPKLEQMLQERLAPYNRFMQDMQQQQQQRYSTIQAESNAAVETFAQKAEFFDDVRDDMADLVDLAAKRGRTLSLEEAYERATAAHPEIAKILAARKAAEVGKVRAMSSVKGAPGGGGDPASGADDIRSSIRRAMEQHG